MSGKKIAVPDEIYERVQKVATAENNGQVCCRDVP